MSESEAVGTGPIPSERSEGESEQSSAFTSVDAAARAYAAGKLDDAGFTAAVVLLPVVKQTPMPDHWFDDWARVDGPLFDLGEAFTQGHISAQMHDDACRAMLLGGHSA